jgi:acetyltransferase
VRRGEKIGRSEVLVKELFCPSSVVVIGVSNKPFNLGKIIAWNLTEFGFDGVVHLLGMEPEVVLGRTIKTSLDEITDPIDLAIILTPAKTVPGLMEQCGRKGIRRVIIESGGFGEFSEEGRHRSDELKRIAAKYHIRFIGPNCIGIMNGANGLCTPFTPMKNVFTKGGVGILAQSGGVALSLLFMCAGEHLGYSKFATIGNKLDIDENDVLEYFIEDPETKIICLYLESINDGKRLMNLARRSSKPIVVHKANIGSLSRRIAQSHTEALANDDQVVDAALKQAGMVRFRDMLGYLDFVKILQLPRMGGRNLAIVSRSGGHAVIAADAAYTYGFDLPPFRRDFLDEIRKHLRADVIRLSNPLDLGDLFDYAVYARIIEHTIQQENVDGILFMHTYNAMIEGEASLQLLGSVAETSRKYGKPVAVCVSTEYSEISRLHKELELPIFVSPERAVHALDRSLEYYERRASVSQIEEAVRPDPLPDDRAIREVIDRCVAEDRAPLLHEALEMVRALGLAVPEHRVVTDLDALDEVVADLPGPYAAKVIAAGVSHKSDSGGVMLNLADRDALTAACGEIFETFGKMPDAGFGGVLVQRMALRGRGTYELIVGGKRDPQFGPVVLVGYGGILVEVFAGTSIRIAPLSLHEIDEMISELPASEILDGIRGLPPADKDALKDAVLRVAYLMVTYPEIDQIDVNPIIVSPEGAVAVDTRIFFERS